MLGEGDVFGESAVAGVADAWSAAAAVLASGAAAVALAAGVGQQRDYAVAGLDAVDAGGGFLDDAGDFVAQGYARSDAAAEDAGHY